MRLKWILWVIVIFILVMAGYGYYNNYTNNFYAGMQLLSMFILIPASGVGLVFISGFIIGGLASLLEIMFE